MLKRVLTSLLILFVVFSAANLTEKAFAAEKKETHITFAAGRPGDAWNVLSHALATFINKRSDWLRADVVATAGVSDDTRLVVSKKKKRSNHILVNMIPGWRYLGKNEYHSLKIGTLLHLSSVWVTLDPELKTLADLKGKSVTLPRKIPKTYAWIFADLLRQVGVWDTVTPLHGGLGAGLTALRDGAAHAGVQMDTFLLGSKLEELQTRGTLYFLQQGDVKANIEAIAKACRTKEFEGQNLPTLASVVPANALGKTQTQDMAVVTCPIFWACSQDVSDDIVYEVTKILYQAAEAGDFANYHAMGKGITPEFLVSSFWATEKECRENYHPGALKYYDEIGVRLKSFGEYHKKYLK
ncbi:MAG: hypothetical protein JRI77_07920 [Deltaproteobacteria bacterium]|nr:hypothetical protein [Deltaproteobacteria bacterium]